MKKNSVIQIDSDSGEFIGYSLDINDEHESVLQVVSYPGYKIKTQFQNQNIIYSNITSDYWGSWSLINKLPEEHQIFPFFKSSEIEQYKLSGLNYKDYWLSHVRRRIESSQTKILHNGTWKMLFSESIKEDWKYQYNKVGQTNLKGHQQLNEVFKTENPKYSDFEIDNIPIAIKKTPLEESGRVKFWRKKIKEESLPPIILIHLSQLSNSIIIDGHSRLLASILEDVPPKLIILYPTVEQEIKPDLEQANKRAKSLVNQYEKNPNLKLEQMNQLLISFYDDRPWLVRRTNAKFNKEEGQWNNEVKKLIEDLNLAEEIDRVENEINEKTGYNNM